MSEDITFCPELNCGITECGINQKNIREHSIPHSVYVHKPKDCLRDRQERKKENERNREDQSALGAVRKED